MAGASQRSVDDIDAWTRAFAEERAKAAGMPVRAWLDAFVARETPTAVAGSPHGDGSGQPPMNAASEVRPGQPLVGDGDSALADPMNCWRPAREAFGQRAASILTISADGAQRTAPRTDIDFDSQPAAAAPQRLAGDQPERLPNLPSPSAPVETDRRTGLADIERALREMREQMDVSAPSSAPATLNAPDAPGAAIAPQANASAEAFAHLGADIGRLVDVMDCGLDRIETESARQTLELRTDVARMFEDLASRIDRFGGEPQGQDVEAARDERPPVADDKRAGWLEEANDEALFQPLSEPTRPAAPGGGDLPTAPAPAAAYDPDSDLFDEPPGPSPSLRFEPPVAATHTGERAPGFDSEPAPEAAAQGEPAPLPETLAVDRFDPIDREAADQPSPAEPGRPKRAGFAWFGLGRGERSRKRA